MQRKDKQISDDEKNKNQFHKKKLKKKSPREWGPDLKKSTNLKFWLNDKIENN